MYNVPMIVASRYGHGLWFAIRTSFSSVKRTAARAAQPVAERSGVHVRAEISRSPSWIRAGPSPELRIRAGRSPAV
jgi:hypothetical protein